MTSPEYTAIRNPHYSITVLEIEIDDCKRRIYTKYIHVYTRIYTHVNVVILLTSDENCWNLSRKEHYDQ